MAASRVDSEVGEYQLTSATAAALQSEVCVVESWTDYNHRAGYVEESLGRSKFRDHSPRNSNSGNSISGNRCVQNNEEWPEQEEETISANEIRVANRLAVNEDTSRDETNSDISSIVNDRKLIVRKENNEKFSGSRDKLEATRTNPLNDELEESQQIFNKCNRTSGTTFDNEYDERHTVREVKIAAAPANNCINNPLESAYCPQGVDKTIGSGKCEHAKGIGSRKNDCDGDGMEISSPRSRAYPHGDDVIVSTATSSTDAFREAPRGEASRKVVHSSARDNVSGKARSVSARKAAGDREKSRDRETEVAALCAEGKKSGGPGKCENCGKSHFPCDRHSRLRKYSGCLNRETASRGKIAVSRTADSTRLAAPIAAATLRRSRSLPRLSIHDSGVACSDHAPAVQQQTHAAPRQLLADLTIRQLLTLRQHYYPEGGWGWMILLVGLLVQILSHGTHGAVGVFLQQVEVRFGPHVHLQAG